MLAKEPEAIMSYEYLGGKISLLRGVVSAPVMGISTDIQVLGGCRAWSSGTVQLTECGAFLNIQLCFQIFHLGFDLRLGRQM